MVIDNAKQHIQRGAFHDYGFVVNRGLGAMKVLRWVGGLEKLQDGLQDLEKKMTTRGIQVQYWCTRVRLDGFVGLSNMLNNISKLECIPVTGSWSSGGVGT